MARHAPFPLMSSILGAQLTLSWCKFAHAHAAEQAACPRHMLLMPYRHAGRDRGRVREHAVGRVQAQAG